MMWFLFSDYYYVFIEMICVTDVHEVTLRTLIEFFVTDVMRDELFSQTQLTLFRNFRNVYVLVD